MLSKNFLGALSPFKIITPFCSMLSISENNKVSEKDFCIVPAHISFRVGVSSNEKMASTETLR